MAVRPVQAHPPHPNPLPRGERGFQMRSPCGAGAGRRSPRPFGGSILRLQVLRRCSWTPSWR
ncbi:hypothetical protein GAY31_07350 [Azospirillum brasilense]|nr:hypothetical protein [Azospirillum brasilense]